MGLIFTLIFWIFIVFLVLYMALCLKEAYLNEPLIHGNKNQQAHYSISLKNARISSILKELPFYRPNFFLPTAWFKITTNTAPKQKFNFFTRKIFEFKDKGQVALDFYPPLVKSNLDPLVREN
jgi:hypothetical protein